MLSPPPRSAKEGNQPPKTPDTAVHELILYHGVCICLSITGTIKSIPDTLHIVLASLRSILSDHHSSSKKWSLNSGKCRILMIRRFALYEIVMQLYRLPSMNTMSGILTCTQHISRLSSMMVNGPSFISSTSMCAPKTPCPTFSICFSHSAITYS